MSLSPSLRPSTSPSRIRERDASLLVTTIKREWMSLLSAIAKVVKFVLNVKKDGPLIKSDRAQKEYNKIINSYDQLSGKYEKVREKKDATISLARSGLDGLDSLYQSLTNDINDLMKVLRLIMGPMKKEYETALSAQKTCAKIENAVIAQAAAEVANEASRAAYLLATSNKDLSSVAEIEDEASVAIAAAEKTIDLLAKAQSKGASCSKKKLSKANSSPPRSRSKSNTSPRSKSKSNTSPRSKKVSPKRSKSPTRYRS